ncbi:hypothetical protein KUV50_00515 [Membranicola marinus]|uniref:Gliding motility-associated C-terminal domain-containing protein n=1 Tax=Membranihabitans marinus TaxID=1227546 RepID=A0A953HUB5_9BACT|nr:hypothetical protein [Membranihabitans marinus]MBY5956596.1 hypothetical protein [Membranihabitans marinus]
MKENCTNFSFLLVFCWSFFCGAGLTAVDAQSCGIRVEYFNVLPTEVTEDGVLYKRVQMLLKNDEPGLAKKFFMLFDDQSPAALDSLPETHSYDNTTSEILIPVSVDKITFYDRNNINGCNVDYYPGFTPNVCTFNVTTHIDLSEDCFNRAATFTIPSSVTIDSVVWFRDGQQVDHDSMEWHNIPPGIYDIKFYDTSGCESEAYVSTCTEKKEAGEDKFVPYCIGEGDTLNLYDHLDADVDSGGFYTEAFVPLDSLSVMQLTFDSAGDQRFYYIAPALLDIPDTSTMTINVRDCSVCAYELIAAARSCADPETIDVTVSGGTPEDTTFTVTLPDGRTSTQVFYTPFQIDFPAFQDSFQLHVQRNTASGICDSTLQVPPIPNPMVLITATEVPMPGDSVGIRISASQGVAPYQIEASIGVQKKSVSLLDGVERQLDFRQTHDSVFITALDDQGCMGTDTLVLTPDCIHPGVTPLATTCGLDNGQITIDPSALPAGRTITWMDVNESELWERTELAPGTYYFTVAYEDCLIEDHVTIDASMPSSPEVLAVNECLLDGEATFYLSDSSQVVQWRSGAEVLPFFSVEAPANEDHIFHIETLDGCIDTVTVRSDEPVWLHHIGYQEPDQLSALLGIDLNALTDFGWIFRDSTLCQPCGDYESEIMLDAGIYTFYAEQGPGCRRDTTIRIDRPDHVFLMPNVITPGKGQNNLIQIFDPLNQMESIIEFQVYDRFGNILYERSDFYTDDDSSINWPNGMSTELPDLIVCIARIKCKEGDEVTMSQDVLILR